MRFAAGLGCLIVICSMSAFAGVYKWTDAQGRVHYSDRPPADTKAAQLQLDAAPRHVEEAHDVAERYKKAWSTLKERDRARAEQRAEAERKEREKARRCQQIQKAILFYRERYTTYRLNEEGKPEFLTDEELAARERELETRYRSEGCRS